MAQKFLNGIDISGNIVVDSNSAVGATVLDIQGTQGQLFSLTNSLSGDLFSVSDISGIPILNVNSSGSITTDGSHLTILDGHISLKQSTDSGFNTGLTIERSANTQKLHIGMDGGAVNFNSPDGLAYKFRNNGTEKFTVDGSGNATFAGNVVSAGFVGRLQGGLTGAPDATIWCVSNDYTDWGIFYDESTPDVIQFKSAGNTTATIALDNGNISSDGELQSASLDVNGNADISGNLSGVDTYSGQNIALTIGASGSGRRDPFTALHASNNTITISQFGQSHADSPAANQIGVTNQEQHLHLITDTQANMQAGTSTKGIFLRSGGDVGIGTKSPGAKLDVAGEVQATSLDINGNADISGLLTMGGELFVNNNLDFSSGTQKKIILGSQKSYSLPAQGTRMRILTLANHTSCRVYIDSSENAYNQPIVLDIFYNSQGSAKPKMHRTNNKQWHTHSNDIRFTSDTSGHIYAEKVAYSTGRTVNIRKVEEFKGTVTILDGSTTNTGGGANEVYEGSFATLSAGTVTSTNFIIGTHTINDVDVTSEASDADDHLMTALAIKNKIADNDNGFLTASSTQAKYLRSDTSDTTTGSLTIEGGIQIEGSLSRGTYVTTANYHTGADNIVLKGNASGISGIFFESEKDGTNINHPSDFAFIQYHPYGTVNSSGEASELIIGVSNDSDDHVVINTPSVEGFVLRVGALEVDYKIYHEGHKPTLAELGAQAAGSYQASGNYITGTGSLSAQDLTDIGNLSNINTGDQTLPTTLPATTSDTLDFFQDSSGVSLHQFNNSLDDVGGNYAATSTGASYGTGLDTRFGSHGINTQGDGVYVDIAGLPTIQAVSLWYKAIGSDNGYIVDFRHDAPGNGRSYLYTAAGSDQYINMGNDTTTSNQTGDIWINGVAFTSGQYNFTSGNWYHIVVITDATNTLQTWDQGIRIGNRSDGTTAGNAGYFDQVRTFNRRLTSSDVALLYAEVETGATADQTAGEILSLIKTVDGTGSLLDADLLDGVQGNQFLRSTTASGTPGPGNANTTISIGDSGTSYAYVQSHGSKPLKLNPSGNAVHVGANRILTVADEGSGNGLDADTLDGNEASAFALSSIVNQTDFVSAASGGTFGGGISVEGNILLTGTATTTNQSRMIDFTGFDKEGVTDFSDRAYIRHTTNVGGHTGSALEISSQNDANDGIAFTTHATSLLRHNGNALFGDGNKPTYSQIAGTIPTWNQNTTGSSGSCTGNAATATTASAVAWGNITSKPYIELSGSVASATATTTINSVAHATYTAVFYDFVIKNGTNVRAGIVYACHDGTNVEFAETSTVDLGDTSDVTLSVDISGTDIRLRATTTSSTWTIKSLIRAI